jgi:hypothetical protein
MGVFLRNIYILKRPIPCPWGRKMDTAIQIKRAVYKKTGRDINEFISDLKDNLGKSLDKVELTDDLILELYRIYYQSKEAGSSKYL